MLTYPDWFSALDRRRIDQRLADQQARLVLSRVAFQLEYSSEADAVQSVLAVFEVVVERLQLHRDHQPTTILHPEAYRLLGDVIAWADVKRPSSRIVTTGDFEAMVRTALRTQSWWVTFLNTVDEPVAGAKGPRHSARDVSRLKAEREQVVLPLLEQVDWTPTRWATKAGVDPHVTIDYLHGTSTPRRVTRRLLWTVLAKELNRSFDLPA
jgi:hypothetical protein